MTKPRLLLVDDDKNTLDGLVKILSRDGFPVSGVLSGYEALTLLSEKNFDIVLTDMKMPGMGGLSLIHEIRKRKRNVPIAIVVITAYSSDKTAEEVTKCGADYFLKKPVKIEELELILERLWERQQPISENPLRKEKRMKVFRKLWGLTTAALFVGITTYAAIPNVSAEETKQATDWNLHEEEMDLLNVTNGDILGERGKDGVWEFHLYTTDGYQEMANGELVWFFGYTHAKDSFRNVGEVTTKEQLEELLEPVKVPSDPIHL